MTARLNGQVAIVTGGAMGIGRGVCLHLASLGAAVVVADRAVQEAHELAAEIVGLGQKAQAITIDIAEESDAARTVEFARSVFGGVNILVNNAAITGHGVPLIELGTEAWNRVLATNLSGAFWMTRAAASQMRSQRTGGTVINVLAIQSHLPIPSYGAYCASKGGLESLTRAFAVELATHGIRVNGVEVASVYTSSTLTALDESASEEDFTRVSRALDQQAATLVGRMGRPRDIAAVVAFLASDDAEYLAGSIIRADGGRMLSRAPDPLIPPEARR